MSVKTDDSTVTRKNLRCARKFWIIFSIDKNNILQTGATDERNTVFDTKVRFISRNFRTMFSLISWQTQEFSENLWPESFRKWSDIFKKVFQKAETVENAFAILKTLGNFWRPSKLSWNYGSCSKGRVFVYIFNEWCVFQETRLSL